MAISRRIGRSEAKKREDHKAQLIYVMAGTRHRIHRCGEDDVTLTNEVMCPVCGRLMILLHTIRRAFAEDLNVFKCKPCGFSTTEPANWTTPRTSAARLTMPLDQHTIGFDHLQGRPGGDQAGGLCPRQTTRAFFLSTSGHTTGRQQAGEPDKPEHETRPPPFPNRSSSAY